jgi:hypothetical protein
MMLGVGVPKNAAGWFELLKKLVHRPIKSPPAPRVVSGARLFA